MNRDINMPILLKDKKIIEVNKRPLVVMSLRKWEEIEEAREDLEDALRFSIAYQETRGEKGITLQELKKKYNLR